MLSTVYPILLSWFETNDMQCVTAFMRAWVAGWSEGEGERAVVCRLSVLTPLWMLVAVKCGTSNCIAESQLSLKAQKQVWSSRALESGRPRNKGREIIIIRVVFIQCLNRVS